MPTATPSVPPTSGRYPQPPGSRGSLKWIQRAVNLRPEILAPEILRQIPRATRLSWKSPLEGDSVAEYRDAGFLERIGQGSLSTELASFWPARGPQWDALACTDSGDVLLVEAKAHIGELCSPPSQAGPQSLEKIEAALQETASYLGATNPQCWSTLFYQLTNRLAHLYFLRKHGVSAWLILVNFIGDDDMRGPQSAAEWKAAYQVVLHVLGLSARHKLAPYIFEVYPSVIVLR